MWNVIQPYGKMTREFDSEKISWTINWKQKQIKTHKLIIGNGHAMQTLMMMEPSHMLYVAFRSIIFNVERGEYVDSIMIDDKVFMPTFSWPSAKTDYWSTVDDTAFEIMQLQS